MTDGRNWTALAAGNSYPSQQPLAQNLARSQALNAMLAQRAAQDAYARQIASYASLAGIGGMGTLGVVPDGYVPPLNHIGPRERPKVETDGIEVGEIYGWRVWYVRKRQELLTSVTMDHIWLPCEVMEGNPSDYGMNGVHAYKQFHQALGGYAHYGKLSSPAVVGRIALWGEVVEHTDGYRAQYGRPIKLETIVPSTFLTRRLLRRLKAKYEVEWVPDDA